MEITRARIEASVAAAEGLALSTIPAAWGGGRGGGAGSTAAATAAAAATGAAATGAGTAATSSPALAAPPPPPLPSLKPAMTACLDSSLCLRASPEGAEEDQEEEEDREEEEEEEDDEEEEEEEEEGAEAEASVSPSPSPKTITLSNPASSNASLHDGTPSSGAPRRRDALLRGVPPPPSPPPSPLLLPLPLPSAREESHQPSVRPNVIVRNGVLATSSFARSIPPGRRSRLHPAMVRGIEGVAWRTLVARTTSQPPWARIEEDEEEEEEEEEEAGEATAAGPSLLPGTAMTSSAANDANGYSFPNVRLP